MVVRVTTPFRKPLFVQTVLWWAQGWHRALMLWKASVLWDPINSEGLAASQRLQLWNKELENPGTTSVQALASIRLVPPWFPTSTASPAPSGKFCGFLIPIQLKGEEMWRNLEPTIWDLGFLSKIVCPVVQTYHKYQVSNNDFRFQMWPWVYVRPDTQSVSTLDYFAKFIFSLETKSNMT